MKNNIIKNCWLLTMLLSLSIVFVSCDKNDDNGNNDVPTPDNTDNPNNIDVSDYTKIGSAIKLNGIWDGFYTYVDDDYTLVSAAEKSIGIAQPGSLSRPVLEVYPNLSWEFKDGYISQEVTSDGFNGRLSWIKKLYEYSVIPQTGEIPEIHKNNMYKYYMWYNGSTHHECCTDHPILAEGVITLTFNIPSTNIIYIETINPQWFSEDEFYIDGGDFRYYLFKRRK